MNILYPRNHLIQGKPGWLVTLLQTLLSGNCHLDSMTQINVLISLLMGMPGNIGHKVGSGQNTLFPSWARSSHEQTLVISNSLEYFLDRTLQSATEVQKAELVPKEQLESEHVNNHITIAAVYRTATLLTSSSYSTA